MNEQPTKPKLAPVIPVDFKQADEIRRNVERIERVLKWRGYKKAGISTREPNAS